jgi:hypothetical protein
MNGAIVGVGCRIQPSDGRDADSPCPNDTGTFPIPVSRTI